MNNEPVAWAREDGVIAFYKQKEVDSQGFKWFPLYTHPADLTDEEMLEVYKKVFNKKNEFKENLKRRSYFEFARAILRKAQEK